MYTIELRFPIEYSKIKNFHGDDHEIQELFELPKTRWASKIAAVNRAMSIHDRTTTTSIPVEVVVYEDYKYAIWPPCKLVPGDLVQIDERALELWSRVKRIGTVNAVISDGSRTSVRVFMEDCTVWAGTYTFLNVLMKASECVK